MSRVAFYYPEGHEMHYERGHPERPERVESIWRRLNEDGIVSNQNLVASLDIDASILNLVHDQDYLTYLERMCASGSRLDMDTYTTPSSWQLAFNAAGGAASIASAVWSREVDYGFALTRPPGHHATRNRGMGFCLLNNVAYAAQFLITNYGARRLAVLDIDLHHGNGTQDIFWERDDVIYISTHQSPLYPGTGHPDEMGEGKGYKMTMNIPLPPLSGDRAFIQIMDSLILPYLQTTMPEMILISYGYDPHWKDPLGSLLLSANGFAMVVSKIKAFVDEYCNGRLAVILEGGYDLDAGVASTLAIINILLEKDYQDNLGESPVEEGTAWQLVLERLSNLWDL